MPKLTALNMLRTLDSAARRNQSFGYLLHFESKTRTGHERASAQGAKAIRKARRLSKVLLNKRELAAYLKVSEEVASTAMRLKQVPVITLGERDYTPLAALEKQLQGQTA